jgi:hypothetical protein
VKDPLKSFEVEELTRMYSLPSPSKEAHNYRYGCPCAGCESTKRRAYVWMEHFKAARRDYPGSSND